jgi:ankyrin repeat protein
MLKKYSFFIILLSFSNLSCADINIDQLFSNDIFAVRQAIEAGADLNITRSVNGLTPLANAIFKGNEEIAKLLIDSGSNINLKFGYDETALMYVSTFSNLTKILQLLIDRGANLNQQNSTLGMTAIMQSVITNRIQIVKILIDAKADLNIKNKNGETALDIAKKKGYTEIFKLIELQGSKETESNLVDAANDGDIKTFQEFESPELFIDTVKNGKIELLQNLPNFIEAIRNNKKDINGRSALITAIIEQNFKMIKFLLENSADPNVTMWNEDALMWSVAAGEKNIVSLILNGKIKPDLTTKNPDGENALDIAKRIARTSSHPKIFEEIADIIRAAGALD